jgi:VCBS repeat-containing protein
VYSVDGAVVATHPIASAVPLRPLVSDVAVGSGSVSVDWIRMGSYAAAGMFVSRIFDATQAVDWGGLSWTAETPAGTSAAFFARHGDTPLPDANWSAFAPVAQPGGAIGGRSRYAQYRLDLASTDPNATPALDDVTIGYALVPPNHPPVAAADSYNGTQDTPLTMAAPGVLANDADADGDALTAVVVTSSAHGALALGANGGFSYTPAAGYAGVDSFTYRANDGKDDSAVTTVTLTIAANAAPQADVTVSGDQGSAKTTVRTGTFSTSSGNELLLAFVSADGPAPGGGKTTVTKVTGGGLTWQLVARSNAQLGDAEIWRAFASGILTNVSVTATLSRSVTSSLTVVSFSGVDTSGVNGAGGIGAIRVNSAASGSPSATLVTTRNNSLVFGVGNDWNHAIARTTGPNQTLVHQYLAPVDDTYWVQRSNAPAPVGGTSVALNDVAPVTDQWNLAAVEIVSR